jgi:hypothetical protein
MLHPLSALRPDVCGYRAEYSARVAWGAVQDFLETFPNGQDAYIDGVRRMYSQLYERARASSGRRFFVDKTPRYYFVISELYRVFPRACYIILLRNPLAVLCSVFNTWAKANLFALRWYRNDLTLAPCLLLKGEEALGEQSLTVHYERVVQSPASEVRKVCEWLGVDFVPEMIEYGRHDLPRWDLGDPGDVYSHTRPVRERADRWVQMLDDSQVWRLASDYLRLLGPETVQRMGYSFEDMRRVLEASRPCRFRLWLTVPLAWLLDSPMEVFRQRARSLLRRGVSGTAITTVMRRLGHAVPNSK